MSNRQPLPLSAAQVGMLLLAALNLAVGAGLFLNAPWAAALWPWTDQPLDRVVLSSFLVAGLGTVLWIGLSAEWGAMTGALLDVLLFQACAAAWFGVRWWTGDVPTPNLFEPADGPAALSTLGVFAAALALMVLVELALLRAVWRIPIRDTRPADRLLIGSFGLFAVVLVITGALLILQRPIWPWPLSEASAALLGFLFLGSAVYFLHGLRRPGWHRMKGQLVAFLLYDLVLAQPYLHLADGQLSYSLNYSSLAVYWAVILYSGGLAAYYLFLNPRTKGWRVQQRAP